MDTVPDSPIHADSSISAMLEDSRVGEEPQDTEEAVVGVKRALLRSPESKRPKKSSSSDSLVDAGKSQSKSKSSSSSSVTPAKQTPKSSSKSSSGSKQSSASKKKKMEALEAEIEEIQAGLEKIKKSRGLAQGRLTKALNEEKAQAPARAAPAVTSVELFGPRPADELEVFQRAERLVPADCVEDSITVWNFFNAFSKHLMLQTFAFDDFCALLNFTQTASPALSDLFCSLLRLLLADPEVAKGLNRQLPRRLHDPLLHPEQPSSEQSESVEDVESLWLQLQSSSRKQYKRLTGSFSSEVFDTSYNGLKFLAYEVKSDCVDHLRWPAILRAVALRLEPVARLRRAVLEVAMALELQQQQQQQQSSSAHPLRTPVRGPANEDADLVTSTVTLARTLALGTTPHKRATENATSAESGSVMLSSATLETLQTPYAAWKTQLRTRTATKQAAAAASSSKVQSTLNQDAIFGLCCNYIQTLHDVNHAVEALEAQEVHRLSVQHKLALLRILIDAAYDTEPVQRQLEQHAEDRVQQLAQYAKTQREQKLKQKEAAQSRREDALAVWRALNEERVEKSKSKGSAGDGLTASGRKSRVSATKPAKKEKEAKERDPPADQINALIDDLVMLQSYGIDGIVPDTAVEEVSESEAEEQDDEADEEFDARRGSAGSARSSVRGGSDRESDEDDGERPRKRSKQSAQERSRAERRRELAARSKDRAARRYQARLQQEGFDRVQQALETGTEKALRSTIRHVERSCKWRVRDGDEVFATHSLCKVYRALHEIEQREAEERAQLHHESTLQSCFVRTEPLGTDRFGHVYWNFSADEDRLFVQIPLKAQDTQSETVALSHLVPPAQTDDDLARLFKHRPAQRRCSWRIYSARSELWRVVCALDPEEKSLHSRICAAFQLKEEEFSTEYATSGHEWIGRKVRRQFPGMKHVVLGVCVAWAPPTAEDDMALWKILHSDGDVEDLEAEEMETSLVPVGEEDAEEAEEVQHMEVDETDEAPQQSPVNGDEDDDAQNGDDDEDAEFDTRKRRPGRPALSTSTSTNSLTQQQVLPRLVRMSQGLGRQLSQSAVASSAIAPVQHRGRWSHTVYPAGAQGLKSELLRLLQLLFEAFKRRGLSALDRDRKRQWEVTIRALGDDEDLGGLVAQLLELEALCHTVQQAQDRQEQAEAARQKAAFRREMEAEGWIFAESGADGVLSLSATHEKLRELPAEEAQLLAEVLGQCARRFFKRFGLSDGVVTAALPAQSNEGTRLFRMEHADGDEEDLEDRDLRRAMRAMREQWTSARRPHSQTAQTLGDGARDSDEESESGSEEEEEDDDDSDSDEEAGEEVARNGFSLDAQTNTPSPEDDADARRLWPSAQVRQRWRTSLQQARTTAEVGLALYLLEVYLQRFELLELHLLGVAPSLDAQQQQLLLYRPPQRAGAPGATQNPRRPPKHAERRLAQSQGQSGGLGARRAKQTARRQIKQHYDDDDDDDASGESGEDRWTLLRDRPARAAARKVVSYAE